MKRFFRYFLSGLVTIGICIWTILGFYYIIEIIKDISNSESGWQGIIMFAMALVVGCIVIWLTYKIGRVAFAGFKLVEFLSKYCNKEDIYQALKTSNFIYTKDGKVYNKDGEIKSEKDSE